MPTNDGAFMAILQIKMSSVRPAIKGDWTDLLLVLFNSDGSVKRATTFSNGNINQSLLLASNGLVILQDQFFFAGYSQGYQTTLQKLIYAKDMTTGALSTNAKTDTDAFVFRHIFDRKTQYCVFCADVLASTLQQRVSTYSGMSYIQTNNLVSVTFNDADIVKTRLTSTAQVPYASKYAGGFTLLDSYKVPRPCAFKSFNMT
mgnify:CR=1 FL=1